MSNNNTPRSNDDSYNDDRGKIAGSSKDDSSYAAVLGAAPVASPGAISPSPIRPGQAISGTVAGLAKGGEYFLLNTAQGQFLVEPKHRRADQLGVAVGQVLNVGIGKVDDGNKLESWGISRQDGTVLVGLGATPSDSEYDALTKPWFDDRDYLAKNPDVASSGISATRHFLKYGALEGRNSNLFNEGFYLQNNADVNLAKASGLVTSGWQHFVQNGAREGRLPCATATPATTQQIATSLSQFSAELFS